MVSSTLVVATVSSTLVVAMVSSAHVLVCRSAAGQPAPNRVSSVPSCLPAQAVSVPMAPYLAATQRAISSWDALSLQRTAQLLFRSQAEPSLSDAWLDAFER